MPLTLPVERIQELASQPEVKSTAVENFLMTLGDDRHEAYENMRLDARSYSWNEATRGAICQGISEAQ